MTRKKAKDLREAFIHFSNGGNLWCYSDRGWWKQVNLYTNENIKKWENVIGDKHLEARKAHALGKKVEHKASNSEWIYTDSPTWRNDYKYRPKPKEVYEWLYICHYADGSYSDVGYATEEEANLHDSWIKFEPSKRIKYD